MAEVEFPVKEVAHENHVLRIGVASCSVLGALEDAIETFEDSVGDSVIEP